MPSRFRRLFRDVRPGDVTVDCGAHTGRVTAVLAARGAEVHAFEPNPAAFAVLERRFADDPRVHCHAQAVSTADGHAPLYLHVRAGEDPVAHATGSSLLASKGNIDPGSSVVVETVDLNGFLSRLGQPVAMLKLDVEGAELELLRCLVETGVLEQIRHVLVEMHDRAAGGGRTEEGTAVRALLRGPRFAHVRLDWD